MKLIVSSYEDEFCVPLVQGICERRGWSVSDWLVSHGSSDPAVRPETAFPDAMIHLPERSSRGLLPGGVDWVRPALDAPTLERMLPYRAMFDAILDFYDPDGRSFTAQERRDTYHELLRFGLYLIRQHRPGAYIAYTVPHSLQDYIVYAVCRAHEIPTSIYTALPIPGYLLLWTSLEEGSERFRRAYQENCRKSALSALPADLDKYCRGVQSDYRAGEPWYSRLRDRSMLRRRSRLRSAARLVLERFHSERRWLARFVRDPLGEYRDRFVRLQPDFFKQPGTAMRDSTSTQHSISRVMARARRTKESLLREYRKLEKVPDFSRPALFVPLHYQPELSTAPLGGVFNDQPLMIELLARHLPAGWRIFVKEHRAVFDPQLRGDFCRARGFYERLAAIANVQLVPIEDASFEYIDNCRAVASVTGTAGWEALLRGKPSMVFGNAWYADCDGVFRCTSEAACADALQKIDGGAKPDPARVRAFLVTLAEVGVRADRDRKHVLTDLSAGQSVNALLRHFLRESTVGGASA